MLLIVGGSKDFNIERLARAAASRNAEYRVIHTDVRPAPRIFWSLDDDRLFINDEVFTPHGTSLFLRYDVFSADADREGEAVCDTIKGWALAHPGIGKLNRNNESLEVSKPRALIAARECGFRIPSTLITNDFARAHDGSDKIIKPVAGGSYTRDLDNREDNRIAFVQEKLSYPELRLFRTGPYFFAFRVESGTLDCREDGNVKLTEVTPPPALVASMKRLSGRLGLDYAAADFKSDAQTGEFVFLEINSMPMFTGYDNAARGRLSDAIFLTLRALQAPALQAKSTPNTPEPE